jgi:hypothetical protein
MNNELQGCYSGLSTCSRMNECHGRHCLITPFGFQGPTTLAGIYWLRQRLCLHLYLPPLGLLGIPEAFCCGGAAGVVSGPFEPGHSLCDLPLVGIRAGDGSGSCCRGVGSALANSSLTDTRSLSSLEMITRDVPPGRSDSSAQAYPP